MELEANREAGLSRSVPDFADPGSLWGAPLEDPYLSRSPLIFRSTKGRGVELDVGDSPTSVIAEGEAVDGTRIFTASDLDRGVVLELAARVVLLLHRLQAPAKSTANRDGLVGASAGLEQVREAIERIAALEVPVLLRGESGTGKELVARAIHNGGPRRTEPFVGVNLGSISPSLAAAELFGSVRGAFTGAVASQQGFFRAAQGGTLFLDEVGEAPPEVQVMLLRALETGEIFPVGSQQARKVDLRVVAATDSDLEARVEAGIFKAPLLHRLSAYEIWLPPLRERKDDIARLFLHFASHELSAIGKASFLADAEPQDLPWLPTELASRLVRYAWPGNVRQLRNVVRHLVIDSQGQSRLHAGPTVERLLAELPKSKAISEPPEEVPVRRNPSNIEFIELEAALDSCAYNLAATAEKLGISRPSLYNLIRRHPTLRTAEEIPLEEISRALTEAGGDPAAASLRLRISTAALRRRLARGDSG